MPIWKRSRRTKDEPCSLSTRIPSPSRDLFQRRHASKNESLLVSLLKQEAALEKRETNLNNGPSLTTTNPVMALKPEQMSEPSATLDFKVEQNLDTLGTKKQKGTKKNPTKPSVRHHR